MRLYLDTSVIGAMFDEEMPERIKITRALLESIVEGKHSGVISNIVLEEIDRCPEELKRKLVAEVQVLPVLVISEGENSAGLLEIYERRVLFAKGQGWICDTLQLLQSTVWMQWFLGIFEIL